MAASRVFQREPLVVSLLERLDDFCSLLVKNGPEAIVRGFTAASSYALHRRVVYETDDGVRRGVTAGLDENGFLMVRDDSGVLHRLYTGGVRPDLSH
jgi:BirA family biotin operon repressor/biotin-[acetyl-CoA-carboxylase] ligase